MTGHWLPNLQAISALLDRARYMTSSLHVANLNRDRIAQAELLLSNRKKSRAHYCFFLPRHPHTPLQSLAPHLRHPPTLVQLSTPRSIRAGEVFIRLRDSFKTGPLPKGRYSLPLSNPSYLFCVTLN